MVKSFTFSFLATMLVISILAPSIEALCTSDYDTVVVMDINEEENNQQESKKDIDEKELFFSNYLFVDYFSQLKNETKNIPFLVSFIDYSLEIVLPPPEYLV